MHTSDKQTTWAFFAHNYLQLLAAYTDSFKNYIKNYVQVPNARLLDGGRWMTMEVFETIIAIC